MKTTEEIRRRLEQAAKASGRSLTHEVEYRLEQSFQEEDLLRRYFGSDDAIELLKELSIVINYQTKRSGKTWRADKATRDAIRAQFENVFDAFDAVEAAENLQMYRGEFHDSSKGNSRSPGPSEIPSRRELGLIDEDGTERTADSNKHPDSLDPFASPRNTKKSSLGAKLSGQQLEILRHLMRGETNKQIARELGLPEATLKAYIKRMLRIIWASNRTQAAILAEQHLEPDANDHADASRDATG
jgi:DNA-binding CsgD family transcriptional regulator